MIPVQQRSVATGPRRRALTPTALRPFVAISFGLGWAFGASMALFTDQVEAVFGEISGTNPIFILAVYSPAFAGIWVVSRYFGLEGIRSLFRRLTLWRMPIGCWAFVLLGIPAVKYVGAALNGAAGEFPFSPWYDVVPALGLALLIGPVEEIGWRGVALPLLQRRHSPLWSALILGGIWGLWHLPSFFLSGTPQSAWSVGPYVIGVLSLSVLVTQMFNAASGSVLVAALFHWQVNNPAWPEAQPWENYILAAVAIIVVFVNRETMLDRRSGVTEVLMPGRLTEESR